MTDLVNISIPTAAGYAVLGYLVVFLGLVMLMCVIFVMGRVMHKETPKAAPAAAAPAAAAPAAPAAKADPAKREFTVDGTHLNERGDRIFADVLLTGIQTP